MYTIVKSIKFVPETYLFTNYIIGISLCSLIKKMRIVIFILIKVARF